MIEKIQGNTKKISSHQHIRRKLQSYPQIYLTPQSHTPYRST